MKKIKNIIENGISYIIEEYKENEKTIKIWKHNDIISRKDKPAILIYNDNKLISWCYVEDGVVNREGKPAFYYRGNNKLLLSVNNNTLNNQNQRSAVYLKNIEQTIKIDCSMGFVHNNNKNALIHRDNNYETNIYLKFGKTMKGFNYFRKNKGNLLKKKTDIVFPFNLTNQLFSPEFVLDKFDDIFTILSNIVYCQINSSKMQKTDCSLPNSIETFSTDITKLKEIKWFNKSNQLSRENNKPAIVAFNGQNVEFYYFYNGKIKEDIYTPFKITKSRNSKTMRIKSFKFTNDALNEYYDEYKLTPFFLSMDERKLINEKFGNPS